MPESVTLEYVLSLAKQLSPLDRIRLIEQITPRENLDARWTGFPSVRARRGLQTTKNEEYDR